MSLADMLREADYTKAELAKPLTIKTICQLRGKQAEYRRIADNRLFRASARAAAQAQIDAIEERIRGR